MFNKFKNFILDNEFRICIYENMINIINYIDILVLEETRISIKYNNGIIVIRGENLSLNKLLDCELLITGKIKSLELE